MKIAMHRLIAAVAALAVFPAGALAQTAQPCEPPALPPIARERNIFDDAREADLGDAIAEHLERDFRVIDDPSVTGYLRDLGARLVRHLPKTGLSYRFVLVDIPDANAFALPGGRVYVSRKLVALTRGEDELAGVLAHELGHVVARHGTETMTRLMRDVLGVTEVKDRRDVFEKYHRLLESAALKPKAFEAEDGHGEADQLIADRVGMFAMVKAGYSPEAFSRFFDRLADTKGKTGNFFTDVFGKTKPEARRLREIVRTAGSVPASCVDAGRAATAEEYQAWQTAVVSYGGGPRKEALHAVRTKTTLEPPLQGQVNHLRISPDGRYLLAQDDSGISVMTREPLALHFRVDAPEARPAQFTADSSEIVFHTPEMRVEEWGVADKTLRSAKELFIRTTPLQSLLSPDGKALAVFDSNFDLTLYEVATGAQLLQKKSFYLPDPFKLLWLQILIAVGGDDIELDDSWVNLGFSPDGRLFAAGGRGVQFTADGGLMTTDSALGYDLAARQPVTLKGETKKYLSGAFAFLDGSTILAKHAQDAKKSGVVAFPSGELRRPIDLGRSADFAVAGYTGYVLVRPISGYAVGVMDLSTGKLFNGNKEAAFDVHKDFYVNERADGAVALYGNAKNEPLASVRLPRGPLGRLRAAAVSPDFKWLAVSEKSRGGVWNLATGERVFHVRGFRGAHVAEDGAVYADFPKADKLERQVARLDVASKTATGGPKLEDASMRQVGQFVVQTKSDEKSGSHVLEVRAARDLKVLWSRPFAKETPRVWVDSDAHTVVLVWPVESKVAKAEIKADARLAQRLAAMKEKEGDYFLQVFDARDGKALGSLLVETGKGSFRIDNVFAAGGRVVIGDTNNRVLVYSLESGDQAGRVFGDRAALSPSGALLAVENDRGKLTLYDVPSMAEVDHFAFPDRVALSRFSADGKSLFVLTADQSAYVLDVSKPGAAAAAGE